MSSLVKLSCMHDTDLDVRPAMAWSQAHSQRRKTTAAVTHLGETISPTELEVLFNHVELLLHE